MAKYQVIKKEKTIDNTPDLIREGYLYIKNRIDQYQSKYFETRLLGQKVVCMSGEEAARLFYDSDKFKRQGAVPMRVQKTLLGVGAIQTMDGDEHIHRKHLFNSLINPASEKYFAELVIKRFMSLVTKWETAATIVLFAEAKKVLCETACYWAGVPLEENDIERRAHQFSAMIDALGGMGPRYWKGRISRIKAEGWIKRVIEDVRTGSLKVREDSPVYTVAFFKDLDGDYLDTSMAAIELINILRPLVAIATYITFAALALHEHPRFADQLRAGDDIDREAFAEEVRRYYPFAPLIGARVRNRFTWNGYEFTEGILVILDIYGTNHDSQMWENPYEFLPERFKERKYNLFDFIPQGGGNPTRGHRCPGDGIVVETIKGSLDFLVSHIRYDVPDQDLSYSRARIPTLPASGFIMSNIIRR